MKSCGVPDMQHWF